MADEEPILASAVVVPEETSLLPPAPTNGSLKRRQSSVASTDSKRPRLGLASDEPRQTSAASPPSTNGAGKPRPIRKPSGQEERQRGKRLFGALLGNLGQSRAPTATQRRRAEIEQKQQDKLRLRDEEDEAERRERLRKLEGQRRREQWNWEEGSMKVRHRSMRARAGMLRTRAEPVIYYLPYETTREEELEIGRQRDEVEDVIDAEVDEFNDRRAAGLERLQKEDEADEPRRDINMTRTNGGDSKARRDEHPEALLDADDQATQAPVPKAESDKLEPDGHDPGSNGAPDAMHESAGAETGDASRPHEAHTASEPQALSHESHRDLHDDAGEVVEGDEDAVMY